MIGVDTHKHVHVAAARDLLGRRLDQASFGTDAASLRELLAWAEELGPIRAFGIECTGSFGRGLVQLLRDTGYTVWEINQPNKAARRRRGKNDWVDADAAAMAVLSGTVDIVPKTADGTAEMIRTLQVARRGAVKASTDCMNTIKSLVVTAPTELRDELAGLGPKGLIDACLNLDFGPLNSPGAATEFALRRLAVRYQALQAEMAAFTEEITALVQQTAPDLLDRLGFGPETLGALLVAVGDNPGRLRSEGAFANLCGVAPIEASSGKTSRHRLNRGGDRSANAALHRVILVRIGQKHPPTMAYFHRRIAEGKSKREAIRCLKRYLAREVYQVLKTLPLTAPPLPEPPARHLTLLPTR
ncbi:IS110 family transposase [Streptomyces monticola]|uniref:IS110 family transposase n=1 Tax=Streptomyces monticola TaxID=2666263 RepID=A0ABW2JMK2_9ACTN